MYNPIGSHSVLGNKYLERHNCLGLVFMLVFIYLALPHL